MQKKIATKLSYRIIFIILRMTYDGNCCITLMGRVPTVITARSRNEKPLVETTIHISGNRKKHKSVLSKSNNLICNQLFK